MTQRHADLDAALDRVIAAARTHLAAVKTADGRADDDNVWRAYVELNNASFDYDELLLDVFGEVTPWDVEALDPGENGRQAGKRSDRGEADPYPHVVSVRQRRDYRVPSVVALIAVAEAARLTATAGGDDTSDGAVESVGEAVIELMQLGDGSLAALDIPELDPLDGVVVVAEVAEAIDPDEYADADAAGPFALGPDDRLVNRVDEHASLDLDSESE